MQSSERLPEDGVVSFLRNIGICVLDYMASNSRRQ